MPIVIFADALNTVTYNTADSSNGEENIYKYGRGVGNALRQPVVSFQCALFRILSFVFHGITQMFTGDCSAPILAVATPWRVTLSAAS